MIRSGRAIAHLLEAEGLLTALFGSAEAYLQTAFGHEPRCLIVDVNLSGMSGIDLKDSCASPAKLRPIILFSALRNRGLPIHEEGRGAVVFLAKPIDPKALLDAVSGNFIPFVDALYRLAL